jgi:putative peptidoglycan lipid II flippase
VRRVIAEFAPMVAGMLVTCTNPVIDSVMAAGLGPGSVAALGYGNKLVAFAMGIASVSLGSAVLPHFSRLSAAGDWGGLQRTARLYARALLAVTAAIAAAAVALSTPIVRILFERGAFTHADTLEVARVQAFYFLQFPFHLTGILFVRLISATAANRVLMWISLLNAAVNVAGNLVLSRLLGVAGIALSTSLVYLVSCIVALACARSRLRALAAEAGGRPTPQRDLG